MRKQVRPGFTRKVFDQAGIDFAMNNPFGPKSVFNPDFGFDCFIVDMVDSFLVVPFQALAAESGIPIGCLDDYLRVVDFYFERDGGCASAFKIGTAYSRTLLFEDVSAADAERVFNRMLASNDRPDRPDAQALEDFIVWRCASKREPRRGGNAHVKGDHRSEAFLVSCGLLEPWDSGGREDADGGRLRADSQVGFGGW